MTAQLDTELESSSAAQGIEVLLPVQIDQSSDSYKEYLATFYPGGSLTKKKQTPLDVEEEGKKSKRKPAQQLVERSHFYELVKYLADVSSYLNLTFSQLRYVAIQGSYMDGPQPSKDFAKNFRALLAMRGEEDADNAAKQFMEIAQSGKMHIIKPSARFKGGYDILYSGVPGSAPGTGSCLSVRKGADSDPFPARKDTYSHRAMVEDTFGKPYCDLSLAKARMILKALFGKDTKAGQNLFSHIRHSAIVPLDFKFKETLDRIVNSSDIQKVLGVDSIADFQGMPTIPDNLMRGLAKYFSILVNVEPNRDQVNFAYSSNTSEAPDAEKQPVSDEYLTMQPDITFSIVVSLPQDIVEYITQTPSGGAIPLIPLNTWASMWSRGLLRAPRVKAKGGSIDIRSLPRYVLTASATKKLNEARKQLGFHAEESRANEDDLFVSNTGRFNYCPKTSDIALDNAINYEKTLEEALQISFNAGSPLNINQVGETHRAFSLAYPEYKEKIAGLKRSLNKYAGCLQSYSWDYNVILTSSVADPDKLVAINLAGTTKPDELSVSDYLKQPFAKSMSLLFNQSTDINSRKSVTPETFGDGGSALAMLDTTMFGNFLKLYGYLYLKKLVPSLQDLVTSAAKEMGIPALNGPEETIGEAAQYEKDLYKDLNRTDILYGDLKLHVQYNPAGINDSSAKAITQGMRHLLRCALNDAYGAPRSNVARIAAKNGSDVADDPHYFSPAHFTLAEFKNVYNYLGGRVFLLAMQAVQKVPKKELFVVDTQIDTTEYSIPNFGTLVKEVMPMVFILGKYVVNSEAIYEKATEISESNKKDTSIGASDIHIPGTKEGFEMFPHQVEANQSLRGVPPRFAVLDVAPGGGKTTLLLSDIACLIGEGHIRRPVVLAPNGLVRNWIEDMTKVTGGTWNMIPITTQSYHTWGDERLTKLISTAPRNTIVVVGFSVAKLDVYPVVIGTHVEKISGTLEFLKKFGFDYIAIDESHKLKNATSQIHKCAKQLCVSSSAKYIRLATGTLISNRLTDVVGQAALFSSQIFRTAKEYEEENSEPVGDSKLTVFRKDTPKRAREQLAKHCAVITFKRKDWAFMLPRPIEKFIPVRLEKPDDEGGKAHQLMYEAILNETLEEIKKNSDLKKLLTGKDVDSEDNDDVRGSNEGEENEEEKVVEGAELDDATLQELEAQLNPYLQRLEQLLTDPLGDPFGEIYFKDVDTTKFVSNKVLKIIERIRLNFTDFPWIKGSTYNLKDVVDFDGLRYILMGRPGEKLTLESYKEPYVSNLPPNKDPRWKEESRGKVIVFCRYTRTVNAIYRHLPADLQKIAVKFHGEVKNKWDNLNAFKSTPIAKDKGVQILIANEQAISEGHNLQMANRLIRVEAPWAPGDLDQSASRIFRPDPSKKFKRENIYLDWILTNGTLEVSKMGRLISKMVDKTQFDEADNPLYEPIQEYQLPLIRMSLDTISAIPNLEDIGEYIDAYADMAHLQGAEFEEMRQTRPSNMLPLENLPIFKDAAIIEHVPYLPDLEIPDRHDFGLLRLNEYLQDTDDDSAQEIVNDKKKLIGRYVHTEFGNGVVVNVGQTGRDGREAGNKRKLTRVYVQLASGDLWDADPSMVYLATNLTEETVKQFTPESPWATKRDKALAERVARQLARQQAAEERRAKRAKEIAKREAERIKARGERNAERNVSRRPKVAAPATSRVDLYQVVYNGFLALEAVPEDMNDPAMSTYKYSQFGDYAYISIPTAMAFDAVLDYLEKKFVLSNDSVKRVNAIVDSFKTRGKKAFVPELAPISEFKNFYTLAHKVSKTDAATKKPIIKLYPVVMNGELLFNVDIDTNPAIKKVINRAIPGCPTKFGDAESLFIKFFKSKGDLVRHVKQMRDDGVEVTNYKELVEEVRTRNFKQGML